MSTCLVVQHAPPESAFALEDALRAAGDELDGVPGAAGTMRAATPAAATELAPVRDLVCARFAGLVAGRVRRPG